MTDLTPETRAEWREDAESGEVADATYGTGHIARDRRILALLDALEEAERERDDLRAAVERDVLTDAACYLRNHAARRFNEHGPTDARGAALWDAGCAIDPEDGNALDVHAEPPSGGEVTADELAAIIRNAISLNDPKATARWMQAHLDVRRRP